MFSKNPLHGTACVNDVLRNGEEKVCLFLGGRSVKKGLQMRSQNDERVSKIELGVEIWSKR